MKHLTVVAVALVMTPAALHRQIDPLAVTRRFIEWSTILLLLSMLPLGLSISLELYIIAEIITGSFWLGLLAAGGVLVLFFALWVWLPNVKKDGRRAVWRHVRIAKQTEES